MRQLSLRMVCAVGALGVGVAVWTLDGVRRREQVLSRARDEIARGDFTSARSLLIPLLRSWPDLPDALVELGRC
ncbi:MAG: hypothetical protein ACP5XB_27120, partial [Isosphaeraceae bacterium]